MFSISFNRNRATFADTRHVLWVLNTPQKAANTFLVYLEHKKRVWRLQMSFPHWGSSQRSSTPLAGFEGPLRGGGKRGEKKRKGEERGKEGAKRVEEKYPSPEINFWLRPCASGGTRSFRVIMRFSRICKTERSSNDVCCAVNLVDAAVSAAAREERDASDDVCTPHHLAMVTQKQVDRPAVQSRPHTHTSESTDCRACHVP